MEIYPLVTRFQKIYAMKKTLYILLVLTVITISESKGQNLNKEQSKFLQQNAKIIYKQESLTKAKWKAVFKEVKNKRIVLLGEFNHGSKEVFLIRNDLIKCLHKKYGFNTIFFESGIGEMAFVELKKNELRSIQMTYGFFGGWRTEEFKQLMDYIKIENISVAGFDVQRTGGAFKHQLQEIADLEKMDTILYANLEERYSKVQRKLRNRKTDYDATKEETNLLIADYQVVYQKLSNTTNPSKVKLLTLITISNRVHFLQYMLQFVKDRNWNKRWATRDSLMAANIQWLIEHIYTNEKIIIVGHNFHIAKYNEKEEVMGEFLRKKYGDEMYSIGVFARTGSYVNNAGKEEKMSPADSINLDIKHIIKGLKGNVNFLPIPPKNKKKGSEWLYNRIVFNDTFIDLFGSNTLILSKHFDGLLLLEKVSMPE